MVNGMSEDEALAAAMAASLQDVNQHQQAVRAGGGSSGGQSSRHVLTQVWKLLKYYIQAFKYFEIFLTVPVGIEGFRALYFILFLPGYRVVPRIGVT
jgi:hypothetical protein